MYLMFTICHFMVRPSNTRSILHSSQRRQNFWVFVWAQIHLGSNSSDTGELLCIFTVSSYPNRILSYTPIQIHIHPAYNCPQNCKWSNLLILPHTFPLQRVVQLSGERGPFVCKHRLWMSERFFLEGKSHFVLFKCIISIKYIWMRSVNDAFKEI